MNEEFSNDRVEEILRSLADHLEIPQTRVQLDLSRPDRRTTRVGRMAAAAAAVIIVATGSLLFPASRAAMADLLGIGSTRIELDDEAARETSDLPHIAEDLTPISAADAAVVLGHELPDMGNSLLGPPEAFYELPEGGVLLAWQTDDTSLWIRPNDDAEIIFTKLVGSGEDIEFVDDLGTQALLIDDSHIFQTPQRRLAARSVLLWYDDAFEYRLEADSSGPRLIEVARSLA